MEHIAKIKTGLALTAEFTDLDVKKAIFLLLDALATEANQVGFVPGSVADECLAILEVAIEDIQEQKMIEEAAVEDAKTLKEIEEEAAAALGDEDEEDEIEDVDEDLALEEEVEDVEDEEKS